MTTVEINGIPLGVQEMGDRQNRTIVFAHPMLWGAGAFDEMLAELANDLHVVAVDIHGHGASSHRASMTLEEMTEDFYLLLKKLNLRKVIWFGCSIGGMIGMRLALAYPEAIDSLILMSTTARLDPPEIKEATLGLWELFRDGHREDIADPAMKYFFAPKTYQDRPELIEKYKRELISIKEAEGMFTAALAAFNRSDIGDAISRIDAPTLVIAGRDDPATPPAQAEFIAGQIPNARLEVIEDANHLVAIEKPREVTRLVREFLNQSTTTLGQ
jgi:pimeloyl-ACP methyl ester carboxylesterase